MKITELRVNGIREPLGFSLPHVSVSWKVKDTAAKQPVHEKITVCSDPACTRVLYEKEGPRLSSIGESLPLALQPRTRYAVRVDVVGDNGDQATGSTWLETGKMDEPWQAKWIGPQAEDRFHPLFFHDFSLDQTIVSARLYVTGLGLYEAYLNGEKAGHELLAPFCNDYNEQVQIQTYDVTGLLKRGENRLEILAGNG